MSKDYIVIDYKALAESKQRRIEELEKLLRAKHACCCRECADEIERLLPDTKVPA